MANSRLTPGDAAALNHAFALLQRGDVAGASAAVGQVLLSAPGAPAALHLQALCHRDRGNLIGAADSFARALAGAPNDTHILNNYAAFLRRTGKPAEAIVKLQAALRLEPKRADLWMNLSLAQGDLRDFRTAAASAERAVALAPESAPALHALAAALREAGDLEGAEAALRASLKLNPNSGWAWTALGIVRRLIGDPTDSLVCYARAHALNYKTPELMDAEASAHLDLGDFEKALDAANALIAAKPDYVAGHVLRAHIHWEYGAGDENDPLAALERAVSEQPANAELRSAYVTSLLEADRAEEALAHAKRVRAESDSPPAAVAHAGALLQLGDIDGATQVLEDASPRMGASPGFCIAFARQLIRARRPDAAASRAEFAAQRTPLDQEAWALLSVAWRMLDDPREDWLCDYERFVMVDDVAPPAGYADQAAFIEALSQTLTALHVSQHAPLNQSLRGGTQTSGSLFGRRDPVIAAARDALTQTVCRMIARLPDDASHPFLSRKMGAIRYSGSWSVRLRSSGRHVNHYHPKGWLSSAFYLQLPPSVAGDDAQRPGWIQFGQPPLQYETGLTPRRAERPHVGRLVLFPSYMWHGTVPFADDSYRMTMAFDALPA